MKHKIRVKKRVWIILIVIILIICGIIGVKKYVSYINSNPYKLEKIGYSESEITTIEKLSDQDINKILKMDYNKMITKFITQKYFIFTNLEEYLNCYKENKDYKLSLIVSLVNVKSNNDYYDDDIKEKADTSKGNLILVNKFNYLETSYVPKDLVDVSTQFAYGTNKVKKEVYEKFRSMHNAAKEDDCYLIITSAYREYEYQQKLWDSYADSKGEEGADKIAARAGYSEHQTGLALDIVTYNSTMSSFESTDEFKWLVENSYKYGFILRYPEDKENITGYSYESWHYRYVGVDIAKKIHDKDITFDEYYAYYIK